MQIDDSLNFMVIIQDNLDFLVYRRQPQFLVNGRQDQLLVNRRRPQLFNTGKMI